MNHVGSKNTLPTYPTTCADAVRSAQSSTQAQAPSSSSLPAGRLHFELSIAAAELRMCSGCDKVLFEPRHAQPHACLRAAALRPLPQQMPLRGRLSSLSPGKKRRSPRPRTQPELGRTLDDLVRTPPEVVQTKPELPRTQPELVRTPPELSRTKPEVARTKADAGSAIKWPSLPRAAEHAPTLPEHARPPSRSLEQTITIPKFLEQFRSVASNPHKMRKVPSITDQFRTVPSVTEQLRTVSGAADSLRTTLNASQKAKPGPSASETSRPVTSAAEQFWKAFGKPEPLRNMKPASPKRESALSEGQMAARVSNAIKRLAGEIRAPYVSAPATKMPWEDAGLEPQRDGFSADVLFSASQSFRGGRPRKVGVVSPKVTSKALAHEFVKATRRRDATSPLAETSSRVKKGDKKSRKSPARVTLQETPSQAERERSKPKRRPRAPSPMPGVAAAARAVRASRRLLGMDDAAEGR